MRRLRVAWHSDLPRYWWERSGSRSVPIHLPFRPSSEALARIRALAKSPNDPALTVCIPSTDRLRLLVPCLESLARTCAGQPVEVIIGDTGSRKDTLALYARLGLRNVSVPPPFSFSRVCNAMASAADGDVLLFLNSDTRAITSDWVPRLLGSPDRAIVSAALVYPGTRRLQQAGVEVVSTTRGVQRNAYRPPRRHREANAPALQNIGLGKRLEWLAGQSESVMAVGGAFLATARTQFESLGGFDERFTTESQDIDFCLRARAQGFDVICRHDIVFSHKHAGSRGRYRFPYDDWRLFVDRWGSELESWKGMGPAAYEG